MAKDNIFIDTKELHNLAIQLKGFEKEIPGAVASALNKTISYVKNKIGKIVVQEYAIKQKEVKDAIDAPNVGKGSLKATIFLKGHTLSMAHFPHSPQSPGNKRKVKIKVIRNNGYQKLNHAFVASTGAKSDDKVQFNVFQRTGVFKSVKDKKTGKIRRKESIEPVRTLSIPQMVGNDEVGENIQQMAQEKLNQNIQHEMEWRLSKMQKNIKG